MTVELPAKGVMLNEIHIVEYLNDDGDLAQFVAASAGDGSELPWEKSLALLEWAKAVVLAPMASAVLAEMINSECDCDEDEDHGE